MPKTKSISMSSAFVACYALRLARTDAQKTLDANLARIETLGREGHTSARSKLIAGSKLIADNIARMTKAIAELSTGAEIQRAADAEIQRGVDSWSARRKLALVARCHVLLVHRGIASDCLGGCDSGADAVMDSIWRNSATDEIFIAKARAHLRLDSDRRCYLVNAAGEIYIWTDRFGRVEKDCGQPADDQFFTKADAVDLCEHLNTVRDCGADWSITEVK